MRINGVSDAQPAIDRKSGYQPDKPARHVKAPAALPRVETPACSETTSTQRCKGAEAQRKCIVVSIDAESMLPDPQRALKRTATPAIAPFGNRLQPVFRGRHRFQPVGVLVLLIAQLLQRRGIEWILAGL